MVLNLRLAEVGKLEIPKLDSKYETGQMFLHRIFGYRGVVLFPWEAKVYDRDLHNSSSNQKSKVENESVAESVDGTNSTKDTPVLSTNGATLAQSPVSTHATPTTSVSSDTTSSTVSNSTSASTFATESTTNPTSNDAAHETKCKVHTFYQVLIDSRDCPFIVSALTIL